MHYDLDGHLKTLFAKYYLDLIDVAFFNEDQPAGKALLKRYPKPLGPHRQDLGRSTLMKATFYVSCLEGRPTLVTVLNRCYGMTKKSDRALVIAGYRRQAIASSFRRGAKVSYRLRAVSLLPENWQPWAA